MHRVIVTALCIALAYVPETVAENLSQPQCSPPPAGRKGLYLHGLVGGATWLGEMGRDSRPGFSMSLIVGFDFFSFLSVEGGWSSALQETAQPYPPAKTVFSTNYLQTGLRFSLPIKAMAVFVRWGVGWLWTYPDVLVRIDNQYLEPEFTWYGGAGFIWHTPYRGFDIGLQFNCSSPTASFEPWIFGGLLLGVVLL